MIDKANNWIRAGMNRAKQGLVQAVCVGAGLTDRRIMSQCKLLKEKPKLF